jgi:molybdopterin synthase catalytic subunit
VSETRKRWTLEGVAFCHRIGKLKVGEINLVLAVASSHREEGFQACQYAIDQFKKKLPTWKRETYQDGSVQVEE